MDSGADASIVKNKDFICDFVQYENDVKWLKANNEPLLVEGEEYLQLIPNKRTKVYYSPSLSAPTKKPTSAPTKRPSSAPSKKPTSAPTKTPSSVPTKMPVSAPTTVIPNHFIHKLNTCKIVTDFITYFCCC